MNRVLNLRRPKHPAKPAFRVSPGNLSLRSLCSLRLMENKFNHRERSAHGFLPSMRLISRSKSEMYSTSCRWR